MMFGGLRVDAALARELIRAVEPMAIEAAQLAERRTMEPPKPNIAGFSISSSSKRATTRPLPSVVMPRATRTTD